MEKENEMNWMRIACGSSEWIIMEILGVAIRGTLERVTSNTYEFCQTQASLEHRKHAKQNGMKDRVIHLWLYV
jgi:hypothetical protein